MTNRIVTIVSFAEAFQALLIRSVHPAFKEVQEDTLLNIMAIFGSAGRVVPMQTKVKGITVRGNQKALSRGWFNHPFNFDPVWLEECTGFEKKGA